MIKNRRHLGYSLIETVVYTAILAALSVFVANTLLASFGALKAARANRRVVLSSETALERITREGRLASSVDENQSTLNQNPSTLVLNSVVSAGDSTPSSKSFFVSGGRLAFQQDGGEIKFITSPNADVSSFVVTKIDSLHSQLVKINLSINSSGRSPVDRSFYASAVLRGGY